MSIELGGGFTQNSIKEATPEKEIEVQSGWTPTDLINILATGSFKDIPFSENLGASSSDWFVGWGDVQFGVNGAAIIGSETSTGGSVFLDGSQPWTNYAF